jgi:hypothetical protein
MHGDSPETCPSGSPVSSDSATSLEPAPIPPEGKRVRRRDLLNLFNFVNFREGLVSVNFRNLERGGSVSFQAFPLPCVDDRLSCRWLNPGSQMSCLEPGDCEDLVVDDGRKHVTVKPEVLSLDASGITFRIPESGYEKRLRSVDRYACAGIEARILQSGLAFKGVLVDFNAVSFRVEIEGSPAASFRWLNAAAPVTTLFSKGERLLYSGECDVGRTGRGRLRRELVLNPRLESVKRYTPREIRGERQVLSPAPAARFVHPLTGRRMDLPVKDISGMGIGVEESPERSVLLPGLMIPELSIEIANNAVISCYAQVVHRGVECLEGGPATVRCGIAFLDMEPGDEVKLSSFVHQSFDPRLRVGGSVDLEELWRFFFETGFIYPSKYLSIEARKEDFKRTYEKLYLESPTIARHFLYQDRGQIYGHMSMIRSYSNSWIIHHHAASRDGYGMAGVKVLDEVGRFVNDFRLHPSAHLSYLICYYREENRFPSRVFGGSAKAIADPKGSSIDAFAYLHLPAEAGCAEGESFQLFPARREELAEVGRFYESVSGGLMLDALDLTEEAVLEEDEALTEEYERQGFTRDRRVFSLKREGRLQALIAFTLSDLGLNLSNLTNCLHVVVVDEQGLKPETLFRSLRSILGNYRVEGLPALVFPAAYMDDHGAAYEKEYILWVLNTDRGDDYFNSLRDIFGRAPRGG